MAESPDDSDAVRIVKAVLDAVMKQALSGGVVQAVSAALPPAAKQPAVPEDAQAAQIAKGITKQILTTLLNQAISAFLKLTTREILTCTGLAGILTLVPGAKELAVKVCQCGGKQKEILDRGLTEAVKWAMDGSWFSWLWASEPVGAAKHMAVGSCLLEQPKPSSKDESSSPVGSEGDEEVDDDDDELAPSSDTLAKGTKRSAPSGNSSAVDSSVSSSRSSRACRSRSNNLRSSTPPQTRIRTKTLNRAKYEESPGSV
eukprot:m.292973 g.292973  ORF g.292973 m.292973 type:complete len:258 (-) comp17847_c0_seq1:350-1123(-)